MEALDRRIFGIIIILLWLMLVIVKKLASGSLLSDRPNGGVLFWLVHIFNFSFLLVANPVAAVLLIVPGRRATTASGILAVVGAVVLAAGYGLMAWALMTLRHNYQVGGNFPRRSDELVVQGPYRFVRHPMYAAAVGISLGLACLTLHPAYLVVFVVYVALVLLLIPVEERGLEQACGARYAAYEKGVKRLIPALY